MANWTYTDQEIETQAIKARDAYQKRIEDGRIAMTARYDKKTDRIVIDLKNGTTFMFPPHLLQGLQDASPEQLTQLEVMPGGSAVHWEALDAGFTIDSLLAGVFGTDAWMAHLRSANARLGGRATSEAKRTAARENGKKGGRPKKAAP